MRKIIQRLPINKQIRLLSKLPISTIITVYIKHINRFEFAFFTNTVLPCITS